MIRLVARFLAPRLFAAPLLGAAILAPPAWALDPLGGSAWRAEALGDAPIPQEVEVFIVFGEDGSAAGSGGCNRFSGGYAQSGDGLVLGPFAATRRACSGPSGEVETVFFRVLDAVRTARRDGDALLWLGAEGETLAVLRPRAPE
ncbi:MAG: META domain-containing protein [Pseudomonadota bacterium]